MIPLHLCCAAGRTKDALGSYSIFLFPIAIGLIVGFDSSAFLLLSYSGSDYSSAEYG